MNKGSGIAIALCIGLGLSGCAGLSSLSSTSNAPAPAPEPVDYRPAAALHPAPEQNDLWARLRAGFALPHPVYQARVENNLHWYAERPDFVGRVVDRAEPYLYLITEELERRNMPTELALLPVVESAFQPLAYSPSHAAGLWQFIPGTGRLYGLKQNWWYDGRRDVLASTQAALDYLDKLHTQFNGDWLLAVAAYNAGEGTVQRAVERNARLGRPTDFWHLDLPEQTEDYVPRLLAVSALVEDPEHYGLTLRPIANEPYLANVDVGSQIDLAVAADLADLSVDELCRLNPGFNRLATDPAGPHRLLLPVDREQAFQDRLADLPDEQRTRWTRHEVCQGESLYQIARRYGTDTALLRELNQLTSNRLQPGDTLLIPGGGRALPNPLVAQAHLPVARESHSATRTTATQHVVAKGDTLWSIARRYGVKAQTLAQWNGLSSSTTLRPGQQLVVNGGRQTATKSAARTIHYKVRRGDSLAQISRRFKVSVADLRRWNDIPAHHTLMPGQRLTVYLEET